MSLQFITGRAGTGKTYECLKNIVALQQRTKDESIIYIVPEQFTLQAERALIAHTTTSAIMNAQVLSFNRLAYSVFNETGFLRKTHLTDTGKNMLVKRTILENKEHFKYFKTAINKSTFTQQVSLTLTEFFKYGITAEKLKVMSASSDENSVFSMKMQDMSLIYEKYCQHIQEGYFSPDEALDVLYGKMERSSLVKNAHVWIDGFYGFTPQEMKIIEKLLLLAKEVNLTLTIAESALKTPSLPMTSVFYEPKETYMEISQRAKELNVAAKTVVLKDYFRYNSDSLKCLEKGLTMYNPTKFSGESDIHIHYADNIHNEAEFAATSIMKLIKNENLRFRDIAVLTGDIDGFDSLLRSLFDECRIPYFMDKKREMTSHPLSALMLSLMDMVLYSMNSNSVFSFLKTGITPLDNDSIEKLENYVLQYGIKGYKWHAPKWQYGMHTAADAEKIETINQIKDKLFEIISPFSENIEKNKKYTSAQISQALINFVDQNHILPRLDAIGEVLISGGSGEKYLENRRCWNIICDIFDTMHDINANMPMTLEEYRQLFESAVSSSKIGIIPPNSDNVTIGDIDRTRLHDIKALFIIGANDGKLPASLSGDGIFAENERDKMEENGIALAHNSKRRTFEEQFIIYRALTKPSQYLYISCSTGTYDGKSLSPASVISKIKKIFTDIEETTTQNLKTNVFYSPQISFHHMGKVLKNGDKDQAWYTAYKFFIENENFSRRTQILEKALNDKDSAEYLSDRTSSKIFGQRLYSSISRLERFAACPYYYFASYTLKAKERPLFQLATPDLGTLFHGVLEEFFSDIKTGGIDWKDLSDMDISVLTEKCVDNNIEKLGKDILTTESSMKYLVKRLKRISVRSVSTLCHHLQHGKFVPEGFEVDFGEKMTLPPIVIETSNGRKLFLNGKIDRVDVYEKDGTRYVKIIDYKSGNKAFSFDDIYYGLQLQLLIYLDAIIKDSKNKGISVLPAGVFYFRIKDPVISHDGEITPEEALTLITKELKLSGLVLQNEDVYSALDTDFEGTTSGVSSNIVPISFNKDNSLSRYSVSADSETFNMLMDHCLKTASTIGEMIQNGYIKPYPYMQGKKTPCTYCPYISMCNFENGADKPNYMPSLKQDEVITLLKNETKTK